jgi:hypothetical protein
MSKSMTRQLLPVLITLLPCWAFAQPVVDHHQHPRLTWAAFRKLPLTDAEFRAIESNVAPYMR